MDNAKNYIVKNTNVKSLDGIKYSGKYVSVIPANFQILRYQVL